MRKRSWVLLAIVLSSSAATRAEAQQTKKGSPTAGKTEWDDEAEKELPRLELHGYFRFRGDLFHNYDMGYSGVVYHPGTLTSYFTPYSERDPNANIPGLESARNYSTRRGSETEGTASIRFRLEPTINITEDVRIKAQIDVFDNMVLGSTPEGFPNPSPLAPIVGMTTGAVPPTAGINSLKNSITAKRAWGEVNTPFGMLAFGRMPNHWGMGMFANDGSCLDCDYGTTWDRVMFVTKIAGHYIVPGIDFASEGLTSDIASMASAYAARGLGIKTLFGASPVVDQLLGRPFDLDQRDDVNQYFLTIAKKDSPKEIKEKLENGETVLNYGLYVLFRNQAWTTENRSYSTNNSPYQGRPDTPDLYRTPLFENRGMRAWVLDPWFKVQHKKLTFELEAAVVLGSIDNVDTGSGPQSVDVRQFGATLRLSNKFLHDTLIATFEAGFASGADGVGVGGRGQGPLVAPDPGVASGTLPVANNFRFNPDFQIDRILWREIVGFLTDAYYFKPSIQYNVTEGFGVKLAFIYSGAVNTKQWPGQTAPLGLEMNFDIFYKSEEFLYASLGYGFLVPFSGLKDPTTMTDPSLAQTIYARIIIRY
jgi:uncharacterized protein (TIGR04551 family)